MQNKVLNEFSAPIDPQGRRRSQADAHSRVDRALDRGLAARRLAARDEIDRLIAAALKVIERTGNLDPKVGEILAEAGLSNQAFYRHFRGKHELLVAVLDEGIRGLADYLERRMAAATTPTEAIREWVRGLTVQSQNPTGAQASRPFAMARGRLAESFGAEVSDSETQVTAPLRRALESAVAAGDLSSVNPAADAEMLYLLVMGWVEARLIEGRIPSQSQVEQLESFALAGLERRTLEQAAADSGSESA